MIEKVLSEYRNLVLLTHGKDFTSHTVTLEMLENARTCISIIDNATNDLEPLERAYISVVYLERERPDIRKLTKRLNVNREQLRDIKNNSLIKLSNVLGI